MFRSLGYSASPRCLPESIFQFCKVTDELQLVAHTEAAAQPPLPAGFILESFLKFHFHCGEELSPFVVACLPAAGGGHLLC